uniref:LacI family DNA-binding transcriptional regulator n=1 Tax=Faecalicatena contorta TaxID=39482 RepID=UPI00359CB666
MKNIDIARKLGISPTAVSLALNHHTGVSEETRQRVCRLKNCSMSGSVGCSVLPNRSITLAIHKKHGEIMNDKPFFSDLISTIQQEALRYSYNLNVLHYKLLQNKELYLDTLRAEDNKGIILLATELDQEDFDIYDEIQKPLILLDSVSSAVRLNAVTINNRGSVFQAVRYAYNLGHRSIGYLKSLTHISNFNQRFEGYRSALKYYNIEKNYHPVFELPCSVEESCLEMKKILNSTSGIQIPTIFLSDLDYIALGAAKALKESGYRIPQDVSMIGYDDLPSCRIFDPPLTSIQVSQHRMGKAAVRQLIDHITTPKPYTSVTEISTKLITRASTAPPPYSTIEKMKEPT